MNKNELFVILYLFFSLAIFILPFRIIILLFAIGTLTLAANVLFRGLNAKTC